MRDAENKADNSQIKETTQREKLRGVQRIKGIIPYKLNNSGNNIYTWTNSWAGDGAIK